MIDIGRRVTLRAERDGADSRSLVAYLDVDGNLVLEGQDLGPQAGYDGEYEWVRIVRSSHFPELLEAMDADPDARILDVLADGWTGAGSYRLEELLRRPVVPSLVHVL